MTSTDALFSPATQAGEWIAVSGQLGLDRGLLLEGVRAQTRQALFNLAAVLESNGTDLGLVVKVNVFLTDMADYDAMNRSYLEAFAGRRMPSRTALTVAGLPRGAEVEIEAWACSSDGSGRPGPLGAGASHTIPESVQPPHRSGRRYCSSPTGEHTQDGKVDGGARVRRLLHGVVPPDHWPGLRHDRQPR
jgi:2-iminobutanoate/2-iminopropanoate deaminase